jgi:two-component system sensor histidine kinase PhoQ
MTLKNALSAFATPPLAVGERDFSRGEDFFQYSYQVVWETESGMEAPLKFTVLESVAAVVGQVAVYRRGLLFWLVGSTVLLIGVQALILFWGLRPLRGLAGEISAIESGEQEDLVGDYPTEVQGVTESLSTLLLSEKKRRDRARHTLSDLAHSLKTPLAVIRSADSNQADYADLVNEQTRQMEQTVSYQLQRAVGASHKLLQMVPVAPVAIRLQNSLLKVYADKGVAIELDAEAESIFQGDERDLLELLGILMDNACKYGRALVRVSVSGGGAAPLLITVEDDGNGIPESMRKAIFKRGVRADSQQSGHGIGLAVAADLAESYRGTLELAQSCMGGAHLRVALP